MDNMILYRYLEQERILNGITWIMEECPLGHDIDEKCWNGDSRFKDFKSVCYASFHELVELSASHGFEGNLWHNYLTYLMVNDENAYSTACEIRGAVSSGRVFNRRIRDRICALSIRLEQAETVEEFQSEVTEFYREFGVGKLGLHKAFRIEHEGEGAKIVPITNIAHVHLSDLVGYELAKQKLVDNTLAFVQGKQANNCLLFGDAGTGKSSSIKAIINQYYDRGLRMIEVYKHQFQDLNSVISQIKNRNYKFIIYMDDLSFEEFEIEYKYLKAVIEGGLEKKPDNVLIYATSNRRHLVREKFSDKQERDDELHINDTVQEKLSLVARFGVTIYFGAPDKKEYHNIVKKLAEANHIQLSEQEFLLEADRWELNHGGRSGRTAQQFINYLLGKE